MLAHLRSLFPALRPGSPTQGIAFFDNAGGSQLPACVIDGAARYMRECYANVGGEYGPSLEAAKVVKGAHDVVKDFVNARDVGEVILGHSTSALCHLVANAYAERLDEAKAGLDSGWSERISRAEVLRRTQVIVSTAGHEANINPWARLAKRGFEVTMWPTEKDVDGEYRPLLTRLRSMVSDRTLLVAFPQVSNILGEVWDAKAVTEAAHAAGAKVLIDGVAYAPHHAPDVAATGCDWHIYSAYKVFGPHMGTLFGRREAFAELTGPNHYFIPRNELPRKWEIGGVSHELCAMVCELPRFARQVTGASDAVPSRDAIKKAFGEMVVLERAVQKQLMDYLTTEPRLRLVGPARSDESRIATVSFLPARRKPSEIARAGNALGLGFRSGHFYAWRLMEELGLEPAEGVVRVSLLGYNTPDEVDRLVRFLREAL
ncbi:MAG TPA: aminotransferase class V-fold PLP-dependent enzyme [Phycisphaerales bacterium]|nr:aminotransferase class V-fold PLP-dependent enzyme [Phycisphaerales bacterium]